MCTIATDSNTEETTKTEFYYRTVQTELIVESDLSAKVFINGNYFGITPLKTYLDYGQRYNKESKPVNYWKTNPEKAILATILSLGVYLPFSAIQVEDEVNFKPSDIFKDNKFIIEVIADGYEKYTNQLECKGEKNIHLKIDFAGSNKAYKTLKEEPNGK